MDGPWIAAVVVLYTLVLLVAVGLLALAREVGLLHRRLPPAPARVGRPGPELDLPAPELELPDLDGRPVRIGGAAERRRLLLFVSSSCDSCRQVLTALRNLARRERREVETIVIGTYGRPAAFRDLVRELKLAGTASLVWAPEAEEPYQASATPLAVLLDTNGITRAKGIVNHLEHLESILATVPLGAPTLESYLSANGHEHHHGTQGGGP